jgi:hypothetical protein
LDVLHKKTAKNCENHQRSYKKTKYCLISRTFKKLSSRDSILLKGKYFKHIWFGTKICKEDDHELFTVAWIRPSPPLPNGS